MDISSQVRLMYTVRNFENFWTVILKRLSLFTMLLLTITLLAGNNRMFGAVLGILSIVGG